MVAKLQDVEATARWHNIWLGCSVFFLMTTGVFAGLFGGYYSAWSHRPPCGDDDHWVHGTMGNGTDFDDACHFVGDDGLYAIPGVECPSECDAWWYKRHSDPPQPPPSNDGEPGEVDLMILASIDEYLADFNKLLDRLIDNHIPDVSEMLHHYRRRYTRYVYEHKRHPSRYAKKMTRHAMALASKDVQDMHGIFNNEDLFESLQSLNLLKTNAEGADTNLNRNTILLQKKVTISSLPAFIATSYTAKYAKIMHNSL